MENVELGEQNLNQDEKIKYYISNFKNNEYLHIRTFWIPEGKEEFIPTKKGVSVCLSDNEVIQEQYEIHQNIANKLKEMLE